MRLLATPQNLHSILAPEVASKLPERRLRLPLLLVLGRRVVAERRADSPLIVNVFAVAVHPFVGLG